MAAASHTYVALRPTWNAWNNLASRTGARVTATVPEVCYRQYTHVGVATARTRARGDTTRAVDHSVCCPPHARRRAAAPCPSSSYELGEG